MRRTIPALVALVLVLAGCGDDDNEPTVEASTTTAAADVEEPADEPAEEDPYEVYKRNAPAGEEVISREDAQARAFLGCDKNWSPGTTDRALADAYRPTGICDN